MGAEERTTLIAKMRNAPNLTHVEMRLTEALEAAGEEIATLEKRLAQAEAALERAVFLAEHLWQMIPQGVWREHGAEWQGQYEGDYWAERVRDELRELAALSSSA